MSTGILLSGGIDSIALTNLCQPQVAFTIDYGQRSAEGEIRAARKVAEVLNLDHEVLSIDCRQLGSGDLAGSPSSLFAPVPEWWPFRNQLLLTLAAPRALALGVTQLLFGSVASDAAHVDGTAEFFEAMDHLMSMQEGGLRVTAPAIGMTSLELVQASRIKLSLLGWSHSCHTAEYACGNCRGCFKHEAVMTHVPRLA